MYNEVKVVIVMNMDILYYIILGITVFSYLLGLFLSHFEKRGIVSDLSDAGFVNIYRMSSSQTAPKEQRFVLCNEMPETSFSSHMDEEII